MKPYEYETLGVMLDMSRNAVMSVEALKEYFVCLRKMGYNCVLLYTEDTYEIEGEPYFGYMRGRYTREELRELDEYAVSQGIELIPCIQTLAHLQGFVPWGEVPVDQDDTLLVDDPRVYEFIENAVRTVRSCFRSNRIHVGMDEAWTLGRGKFLDLHGHEAVASIMKRHLARVRDIVHKYGMEPLIWSDMFFRSLDGHSGYYHPRREMPREVIDAVPDDVIPVYWDYYQYNEQAYDDMLCNHEQLSDKTWFAGGAWTWRGFLPINDFSILSMRCAMDACRKHGVKNIFFTMWGDDGAECSRYAVLPTLYNIAQYLQGNDNEEKIKAGFAELFDASYDAFMSLDQLNRLLDERSLKQTAPKRVFYNDYFNGVNDIILVPDGARKSEKAAAEWHAFASEFPRWSYLFDTAACLADVLAVKYDLGVRTRAAYLAGDKEALRALAENEYAVLPGLIDRFALAFEKQWNKENKPTGFDVQDIRLGGLIRRTDSCRRRLLAFVNGEIDEIPELAFELLTGKIPDGAGSVWGRMVTPNRITWGTY